MKSFDLNLLRALHELLEAGSVTAAAARLHLSVPATSHTLARLRDLLADPLLVRAGRRLVPTPRALELREPVALLVAQAQALVAPPSRDALATVARVFVVRAPEGVAVVYGAALAMAVRRAMPRSALQLVPEAHGDPGALREGRIDLDVGHFRGRDPELRVRELSQQPLLVAWRDEPATARLTLKRYLALEHIAVSPRVLEDSPVDAALRAQGLQRRVVLTLPSMHAALLAAARSPLAATVSQRIARAMAPGLGLRLAALPMDVAAEPTRVAWHPRHDADPAHAWLRDTVLRMLTAAPRATAPVPALPAAGATGA